MELFAQAYENLNEAQRQAVDTIEGPVMVLAGPGTGKTQVLALRIAKILQETDTPPQSILALTFTESAAANMRSRLVAMIGTAGYSVQITTFHAFCSLVIQQHPEYFAIDRTSQPLADIEKFQLFESLLERTQLEALKPMNKPFFYISELIKAISDLKREAVSPERLAEITAKEVAFFASSASEMTKAEQVAYAKKIAKWQELVVVYEAYQVQLVQRKRYDFDDMIMYVKTAFESQPDLLVEYQEQLQYFLVDEYQDTNSAQNAVVSLLASFWGEQANLFVVGDPHQSIYRFQGASVENVLQFTSRYPQATVIHLTIGYRCPQQIYDAAHWVIGHNLRETAVEENLSAVSVRLRSAQQKVSGGVASQAALSVRVATNQLTEVAAVVSEIQGLLDKGVAANKIAVLFRKNAESEPLQASLLAAGVPFSLATGHNALASELISQVLELLEVLVKLHKGEFAESVYTVLHSKWFGLAPEVPMKLAVIAHKTKQSIWEVLTQPWDEKVAAAAHVSLSPTEFAAAAHLATLMTSWLKVDSTEVLPVTLETIFSESGLLAWIRQQPNHLTLLQELTAFFDFAEQFARANRTGRLIDLLNQLAIMESYRLSLPLLEMQTATPSVTLSTVHKAKGMEWDYVFLLHVYDGKWGNAKNTKSLTLPSGILTEPAGTPIEDDRRLFYVALTRAVKHCFISYPKQLQKTAKQQELVPSIFVHELRAGTYETPITLIQQELTDAELTTTLTSSLSVKPAPITASLADFLAAQLVDFSLSVSSLNMYLEDPSRFLEDVLLKVPKAKAETLLFGTAMHSALELLGTSVLQHQQLPTLAVIEDRFETVLARELLAESQLQRRLKHGKKLLSDYYAVLQQTASKNLLNIAFIERSFSGYNQRVYLGDIALSGRIDRIDWLDDSRTMVKVVDYKTGKPKSANEIEGAVASQGLSERELSLPESIRGPMKRQLLFYKLLADLDPSFKPTVTHGEFVFLEPSASGKLVERQFELRSEDVADLQDLIIEVMAEIRAMDFISKQE